MCVQLLVYTYVHAVCACALICISIKVYKYGVHNICTYLNSLPNSCDCYPWHRSVDKALSDKPSRLGVLINGCATLCTQS